jgi:hypothetical protein
MITHSQGSFSIPDDWPSAIRLFWDLEEAESITTAQWEVILDWLFTTEFDDRSFVAGQQAARLIQKKAPTAIKERISDQALRATDRRAEFCKIALE